MSAAVATDGADTSAHLRWRGGEPLAFVWQGRLYMVRQVVERSPGRFRVVAAAGRSGPREAFDVTLDVASGTWRVERASEPEEGGT